jgi:hypothetical protein
MELVLRRHGTWLRAKRDNRLEDPTYNPIAPGGPPPPRHLVVLVVLAVLAVLVATVQLGVVASWRFLGSWRLSSWLPSRRQSWT